MSKAFEDRAPDDVSEERDAGIDMTTADDLKTDTGVIAPVKGRSTRRRATPRSAPRESGSETLHAVEEDRAGHRKLRVLVADEGSERFELLASVVAGLGHEVVAGIGQQPEVALVGIGVSSDRALELIDEIVHDGSCPVIALLPTQDSAYVREAARRGIFGYIVEAGPEELQSAIDITLRRFTEYHDLQGAFGRRAVIEQAKGMLMARHGINGDEAFDLLRNHSQHGGGRLSDIAAAVVDTNSLLPEAARRTASGDPI